MCTRLACGALCRQAKRAWLAPRSRCKDSGRTARRSRSSCRLPAGMMGEEPFFSGIIRDITERKQSEARIQQQLQRLAGLHSLDVAINTRLDLHHTVTVLLDQVMAQLPVDGAVVRLLDAGTRILEHVAARGSAASLAPSRIPLEHELAGAASPGKRAALSRRRRQAQDLATPGGFRCVPGVS